jgi:hypothetical protein
MTRTLAAIAAAPLAVIPVLLVLFGPWALSHGGVWSLSGILVPALVVAYPMLILFGLPMHLVMSRQRVSRPRAYLTVGMLLGAVPVIGYYVVAVAFEARFVMALIPGAAIRNLEWGAIGAIVFGMCSAAVALAFRAIAVRRLRN